MESSDKFRNEDDQPHVPDKTGTRHGILQHVPGAIRSGFEAGEAP